MFSTLIESRRVRQRNFASNVISGFAHALIVVGTVYATAKGSEPPEEPDETAVYTTVKPKDPTPPAEKPKTTTPVKEILVPKGFKTLPAPITIPTVIPNINFADEVTDPGKFIPVGLKGGDPNGFTGPREASDTTTRFIFEVEKVARMMPGNAPPEYPVIMKQTRQTGSVKVAFVIDTTGKADLNTLRILETTHSLFSDAVRKALPKYRFQPAEIGGRKVRMHVELPFIFSLDDKGGK